MGTPEQAEPVDVGLAELHRNTSDVVRRVQSGEELVVTVSGRPAIRMVGLGKRKTWVPAAELESHFGSLPSWGRRDRGEEFLDEEFRDPWDETARARTTRP